MFGKIHGEPFSPRKCWKMLCIIVCRYGPFCRLEKDIYIFQQLYFRCDFYWFLNHSLPVARGATVTVAGFSASQMMNEKSHPRILDRCNICIRNTYNFLASLNDACQNGSFPEKKKSLSCHHPATYTTSTSMNPSTNSTIRCKHKSAATEWGPLRVVLSSLLKMPSCYFTLLWDDSSLRRALITNVYKCQLEDSNYSDKMRCCFRKRLSIG